MKSIKATTPATMTIPAGKLPGEEVEVEEFPLTGVEPVSKLNAFVTVLATELTVVAGGAENETVYAGTPGKLYLFDGMELCDNVNDF